ncbi:MAG: tetratricopeptide repeat protein [Deltaproteobacteria bacterium]|nr:tetratricopeptide repeat protein [Deltaproteobacteria bacterium]MCW5801233.1 tetratricopeptide repeat protein [Deltaproteobacteria bacterium]
MRGIVIALVALAAGTAAAEPHPRQAEIDKLFGEGRELIAKKQPDRACEVFKRAYEIDPRAPGVLLNLGLCNEMQNKFGTSLRWFRRAQAVAGEEKIEDYRAAAEDHTSKLFKLAASLTIDASAAPGDVEVKIDGEVVDRNDYPLYYVDSGKHVLEATSAGKKTFRKSLDVGDKSQQTIQLTFTDKQFDVVDPGKGRRRTALIVGGLGVAMMAGSFGLAWAMDGPGDNVTFRNNMINYVATPIAIGGGIVTGIGILLYATAPKKERRERTVWLPVVAPDQTGFAVAGRF